MKVLLVAYCTHSIFTKLFKIVTYPLMPRKDDEIEYQDGWALSGINSIYISLDALPEINLSARFNEEEHDKLIKLGWSENFPKENQ